MDSSSNRPTGRGLGRRDVLKLASGLAAVAVAPMSARAGHAGRIRLGLIGCGGRGTGAALQAAVADPGVAIVALADAFSDQLDSAAHVLARDAGLQFDCPAARRFSGPDGYHRLLDTGVDAVVVAAPPHLREWHVEAAVAAGCHLMCEAPAAANPAGVLQVAAAFERARAAGLVVATGLHGRRDRAVTAAIESIRCGAIGPVEQVVVRIPAAAPWRVAVPAGCPAHEARLRNWISDESLSGGPLVERHLHALDRGLWAVGDRFPESVEPADNRGVRGLRYRFAGGAELLVAPGETAGETVLGPGGACRLAPAGDGGRFQATMDRFVAAIRGGEVAGAALAEDGRRLVAASLAALMGRAAAASGRAVGRHAMPALDTLARPAPQIRKGINLGRV